MQMRARDITIGFIVELSTPNERVDNIAALNFPRKAIAEGGNVCPVRVDEEFIMMKCKKYCDALFAPVGAAAATEFPHHPFARFSED